MILLNPNTLKMKKILYQVIVWIDQEVRDEWLRYMTDEHIPDVLETGLFAPGSGVMFRAKDLDENGRKAYVISYYFENASDLGAYQTNHAPALQEDHTEKWEGRFNASRLLAKMVFEPVAA